jgi:hypothetical protein
MRSLASQLLALEAVNAGAGAERSGSRGGSAGVDSVCEKLRVQLTRFAGVEGFASLLRRALAIAREEVPALGAIKIGPGGILEGLEGLEQRESEAGAVAIIANLLNLLAIFIGEALTWQLVREVWPELPASPPSSSALPTPHGPSNSKIESRPT